VHAFRDGHHVNGLAWQKAGKNDHAVRNGSSG
jgi:hypothetical protein